MLVLMRILTIPVWRKKILPKKKSWKKFPEKKNPGKIKKKKKNPRNGWYNEKTNH